MLQFIIHQFCLGKWDENGTKKPSAKPGTKGRWPKGKANRVPRVKVLNYLKKVALLLLNLTFHKSVGSILQYLQGATSPALRNALCRQSRHRA